jgi:hypothetical protein
VRSRSCRWYAVSIGQLEMNFRVEVRKGSANVRVKLSNTRLIRGHFRLRRVVDKVVREQFLEDLQLALALNFLRVASTALAASDIELLLILNFLPGGLTRSQPLSCMMVLHRKPE